MKTWLLDKFQSIVDGIKGKIEAVTGFFGNMYDAVVGNSFVPDMVHGIATEFGRLDGVMVAPTRMATAAVMGEFQSLTSRMQAELRQLETVVSKDFTAIGKVIPQAITPPPSTWQSMTDAVKGSLGSMGQIAQSAFEGGGGVAGAAKSMATKVVGSVMGMIPVVGPFLSNFAGPMVAGISKIGGAIKGLFGGSGEHGKVNDLRDQFIDAAGGLDALRLKAFEAGVGLERLLAGKKVKDFEAAVAELNGKMKGFADEQAADAERLTGAIQRYGFTFEELGPKFRAQQLHAQSTELIEDWRVLIDSGIDMDDVNERMSGSMNDYLKKALQTGAEVPAAMRPILQKMVEQGLLTDANGEKIVDLESAGVTYSETMTQGFQRIVTKLEELIGRIGTFGEDMSDLPDDARQAREGINRELGDIRPPTIRVPYRFEAQNSLPSGGSGDRMHSGGVVRAHSGMFIGERLASDEVPIIAQTGEGILSRRGMAALGGEAVLHTLNRGGGSGRVEQLLEVIAAGANNARIVVLPVKMSLDDITRQGGSDRLRKLVQDWLYEGGLSVPQRSLVAHRR